MITPDDGLDLSRNMLWYTCLIKHAETLLRTKDCCTHSLRTDIYKDSSTEEYRGVWRKLQASEQNAVVECVALLLRIQETSVQILVSKPPLTSVYTRTTEPLWLGAVLKALSYMPEGRGFETWWGERMFSIYPILPTALDPEVHSACNRNEYQKQKNVSGE
jgi:hypothetical protein